MFIVIQPDGGLTTVARPATAAEVRTAVGDPGFDLVNFDPEQHMYAFVNDEGHRLNMPPNRVGLLILRKLGHCPYLLVGPIVITGWQYPSAGPEFRDLTAEQVQRITGLHAAMADFLGVTA
jgi:hypothetical protein